ncbi:MAG: DUF1800 family protein [Casimicrobiaceae bacterium]
MHPHASTTISRALAIVMLAATAGHASIAGAVEPTATVVEYYNASLNIYFATASSAETAALDLSTSGWTRTGASWGAWATAADNPAAVPVCRFSGKALIGPITSFYTADPNECAQFVQAPAWTYNGIAFYVEPLQAGTCKSGTTPVLRSFSQGAKAILANYRYTIDATAYQRMAPASALQGAVMCSTLSTVQVQADAVRLLEQATFGPTDSLIAHVVAVGAQAFLDEQLAAPTSQYPALKYVPFGQAATFCPTDPDPQCARDYYSLFLLQNAFFTNALGGADQLRQRVAFALSQILVTSGLDVNVAYGMGKYQQIFLDNAFGNYETILTRVTLSPVMGDYLNMVNNDKPSGTVQPNENYAREFNQLFSVGLLQLNLDGTPKLDTAGAPIPAYGQDAIEGFAHVFTGWTYPLLSGGTQRTHNPKNFLGDMVPVDTNHDRAAKLLLSGFTLPAGGTITADLTAAIHNAFTHPNVGPFIGRQLIQKLVTGDPTPQYVSRVATVFNNNGAGVRGDMRAVVKAILTDPEARGPVKIDPGYGKLREPVLFMTGAARALSTQSDGVYFGQQSGSLGQSLFYAPSVFNYYPPTYLLPDTARVAPEFAIANSTTSINRYNVTNTLAFGTIAPLATLPGAIGTIPDWSALSALAADANAMLDRLNLLMLHGTMSAAMRSSIVAAVNAIPATTTANLLTRAKTAFYLVASSAQYQVER